MQIVSMQTITSLYFQARIYPLKESTVLKEATTYSKLITQTVDKIQHNKMRKRERSHSIVKIKTDTIYAEISTNNINTAYENSSWLKNRICHDHISV